MENLILLFYTLAQIPSPSLKEAPVADKIIVHVNQSPYHCAHNESIFDFLRSRSRARTSR